MEEDVLKSIAEQLRKPHGEFALQVGNKMNESNAVMNMSVINALDLKRGEHVLEIGMANGFFVNQVFICYPNIIYSGCDYSDIMVEEAKVKNKQFIDDNKASFYNASADSLPFEDSTFDTVFTINTLYFWDNPLNVLNEISRILKPKGKLVIAFRPKHMMKALPFVKYNFTMYDVEELANLLFNNNFLIKSALEVEEPDQNVEGEQIALWHNIIVADKNEHKFSTESK